MEDVLAVYHLPYDPDYPVVCMDESYKQMIGEVREPIPCVPGRPERVDDENVRNGVAEIFMEVEPLSGKRHMAVTERCTRKDWARQIKEMLDVRYPNTIKVRLEIHFTPKHGSWLNMDEIELSILKGQCLNRRIPDMATMQTEAAAWEKTETTGRRKLVGNSPHRMLGLN